MILLRKGNIMERLIAIGDIHGEINKLNRLIRKLNIKSDDTLVFLGDYIARGKYSKQVADRLIELSNICNCEFLMGNHEYCMLATFRGIDWAKIYFYNDGGEETIKSYGGFENILKIHGNFYNNLKYYYLTEDFLFVHAGIRPDKFLDEQDILDLLLIRGNFIDYKHKLKQKIIFGHTPFKTPFIGDDKIGINTGCGIRNDAPLTAYICNEDKFITS